MGIKKKGFEAQLNVIPMPEDSRPKILLTLYKT